MQIGILDAFPAASERVNWNTTPADAYIRFLEQARPNFEYVPYALTQGEFPDSPEACEAYLITGSPRGVYDSDAWIAQLSDFIRASYQAGKKLVGICFGHQILAHALGGYAAKSQKGWGLGLKDFAIHIRKPWMTAPPEQCALYFIHQDQVIQLPPNAELLGGNDFCPYLFFSIGEQALGIQGHPEFTPELMSEILTEDEAVYDAQVYADALHSLQSRVPDNQLFAQWIANFIQNT